MFVIVFLPAMLEFDALFVVVIFRGLVRLLEECVLNAPCLARATGSPESQSSLVGGGLFCGLFSPAHSLQIELLFMPKHQSMASQEDNSPSSYPSLASLHEA